VFYLREFIDGAAFTQMVLCASEALESDKQRINDLNVFPVPDGDTGTNMSLTLSAAAAELRKKGALTLTEAADCAAGAMLRGARGNSGVILSLLFRGLSKELKGRESADPTVFSAAMSRGVRAAYKAVMKPTEGTILTVSRLASAAAEEFAKSGSDIELMLTRAILAGREAVSDTVKLNPVLARAGVVDAGGEGYMVILDAMLAALEGRAVAKAAPAESAAPENPFAVFDEGEINFTYCTEFIVEKENQKSPMILRQFLEGLGDCVVVVDDDEIIKTHVHTNDPGRVLTEALTYGSFVSVKIENMRRQHTEQLGVGSGEKRGESAAPAAPEKKYGVVAVCAGAGLEKLFRELGADAVVAGGQTMNPSTEDILQAIESTPAEIVYVFPNNKNIVMAAQQCQSLTEKRVVVIPTKTVPQGVTAMLNMDPALEEEALTEVLGSVIDTVHTALVTYAARDSEFGGYHIEAGQYLALLDGALIGSFAHQDELLQKLGDALEALTPEFLSVYYGSDVDESAAVEFADVLESRFADAELTLLSGGQPVYYYMVSAE